jgi:hypothetical protein
MMRLQRWSCSTGWQETALQEQRIIVDISVRLIEATNAYLEEFQASLCQPAYIRRQGWSHLISLMEFLLEAMQKLSESIGARYKIKGFL